MKTDWVGDIFDKHLLRKIIGWDNFEKAVRATCDEIRTVADEQKQEAIVNERERIIEIIRKDRPVFFKDDYISIMTMDESLRIRKVLRIEILEELKQNI